MQWMFIRTDEESTVKKSGFLTTAPKISKSVTACHRTGFPHLTGRRCWRVKLQSEIAACSSFFTRVFLSESSNLRARLLCMCLCMWFIFPEARAQASQSPAIPDIDFQSWNEIDIKTLIAHYLDVNWIARLRISSTISNPADYLFGADWNFSLNRHFILTPSWYYFGSRSPSGVMKIGQSPILGFTPMMSRRRWNLSDRNRFCGRFGSNGIGPSWDYRNRPQVEYQLTEAAHSTSIFVWNEETYYSSYHGWTRNRLSAGVRRTLQRRFIADVYYLREDDQIGTPKHINTAAVLIEMRLR